MTSENLEAATSGVRFLSEVKHELNRALEKFPGDNQTLAAMMEELGEANMALLDHDRGEETPEAIYKECVQTAAMALRLGLRGTTEYRDYKKPFAFKDAFEKALTDTLQAFFQIDQDGSNYMAATTRLAVRAGIACHNMAEASKSTGGSDHALTACIDLAAAALFLAVFGSREFPKYRGDGQETVRSAKDRGVYEKPASAGDDDEPF